MNDQVLVCELDQHVEQTVTLRGWVHNLRSSGKISFIELRDGTGFVQCVVVAKAVDEATLEVLAQLTQESSVAVEGAVGRHPKHGTLELKVARLELIHRAVDYPVTKKEHGPEFLLERRHLWLRSKTQWAIQRVRDTVLRSIYGFLHDLHFVKIDSPILTSVACEGTTTLFDLEYFDLGKAYLSQSGQLYLEAAIAAHGRVFDFGPVFRAEKSKTRKHLTEFWMMDAEMAFFEHDQNVELQERLICHVVAEVLRQNRAELELTGRDVAPLEAVRAPFTRITHAEAVAQLRERGSEITEDQDLGAGDEALLAEIHPGPVFIERWPAAIKAFYMKRCPDDPRYVLAADLMAPEGFGELIGGSQREDDLAQLEQRMREHDVPVEEFEWYLDARRYGSVPHSGFGIGLERLVAWISGAQHIRETIPFPRMIYRLKP